jgi:hypothetical protein
MADGGGKKVKTTNEKDNIWVAASDSTSTLCDILCANKCPASKKMMLLFG